MCKSEISTSASSFEYAKPSCKTILENKIYLIDNVLTSEQCDTIVKSTLELGYNINSTQLIYGKDWPRTSKRITDAYDENLTNILTKQICSFVPQKLKDGREVLYVHQKSRFSEYTPGGFFKPHYDQGDFISSGPNKGHGSYFTIILYLNDDFSGGATHFCKCKETNKKEYYVQPKKGSVLVFKQSGVLHEGQEITKGKKYIMVGSIFYSAHIGSGPREPPSVFRFSKAVQKKQQESVKRVIEMIKKNEHQDRNAYEIYIKNEGAKILNTLNL